MWSRAKATDAEEKEAVVELRKRVTDGTQPVEEQLRKGGEPGLGEGIDDQTLLRWLRAENNSVDKAEKRLRKHAIWREETFPKGRVPEEEIPNELEAKKVAVAGWDKYGRRVLVLKVNRHLRAKRDLEELTRFLCYSLDKGIRLADLERNPTGRIVGIFDLRDISMANIDQAALKGVFDMLQNHYPERLGTLWMFESPSIFWVIWKAVSPFIDPVTRAKVRFVSEKAGPREMAEEIPMEVMPKDFGGQGDVEVIETVKEPEPKAVGGSEESRTGNTDTSKDQKPGSDAPQKTATASQASQEASDDPKYPPNGQVMGP